MNPPGQLIIDALHTATLHIYIYIYIYIYIWSVAVCKASMID